MNNLKWQLIKVSLDAIYYYFVYSFIYLIFRQNIPIVLSHNGDVLPKNKKKTKLYNVGYLALTFYLIIISLVSCQIEEQNKRVVHK